MRKLYLSQNLNVLSKNLADALAQISDPLQKRHILVPSAQMKQWLMLELAKHSASKGIAGCKIYSIDEWVSSQYPSIPSSLELCCLIYEKMPVIEGVKRIDLSRHLTELFFSYGQHGIFGDASDWQVKLFHEIFTEGPFRLPMHLQGNAKVYCFGFDFLPQMQLYRNNPKNRDFDKEAVQIFDPQRAIIAARQGLSEDQKDAAKPTLSKTDSSGCFGIFDPCSIYLFSPCIHFWEDTCSSQEQRKLFSLWKQKGASNFGLQQADLYFDEAPTLLANWGKLGKEMLKLLDTSGFETKEVYGDISDEATQLHRLQKEILLFEKAEPMPDASIQIFQVGASKLREVEVLREKILSLVQDFHLQFSDIAVLAPDIQPYLPLIEYVFEGIPFRFPKMAVAKQSSFYHGLCLLMNLSEKEEVIQLFETTAFKWEDKERCIEWIEEIFDHGFESVLNRIAMLFPGPSQDGVSSSDIDLLEKLFVFLQSFQQKEEKLSLKDWAVKWEQIADTYLQPNFENEADLAAFGSFCAALKQMKEARLEGVYPFEVIQPFLKNSASASKNNHHLHAIRIESIETGAILPVKALFLIGMDEESFPRKKLSSPLDLLKKAKRFIPRIPDVDRYLFLQAIFAAQDHLYMSYCHLSSEDGKPVFPSLLVQEMQAYALTKTIPPRPKITQENISYFSIRLPEENKPVNMTIALQDLVSFARHPWKYFLQKKLRIYVEDRKEASFIMQRESLLRSALKWDLSQVLALESEPLPKLVKEALFLDCQEKQRQRDAQFLKWGKQLRPLLLLETTQCLELQLENGSLVRITGEIPFAFDDGIVHLGEDRIGSLLKIWPEALTACMFLKSNQIYFLKSGKIKTIANVEEMLKKFVGYYLRSHEHLSPLLPDWADALLRKGPDAFSLKTTYEDATVNWVMSRLEMPETTLLFQQWAWLKESFSDLIALYPTRTHETV